MSLGYIRPELAHLAVPIGEVAGYPGNPRRGDRARITASLTSHGQYTPLLVQASTGYVVKGNNTLSVMRDLGWTEVAAVRLQLDDDRARAILMIDNRSSDDADYDPTAAVDLLSLMPDLEAAGWTVEELDDMIAALDGATVGLDTDLTALDRLPTGPDVRDLPHPAAAVPSPPAPAPVPSEPAPAPPSEPPAPTALHTPAEPPPQTPTQPRPAPATPTAVQRPVLAELLVYLPPDDRAEAMRLLDAARDWIGRDLSNGEIVLRALRVLAVLGDTRHDPGRTIRVGTLLPAAGYDIFTQP